MYSRDSARNVQSLPNLPTQASRGGIFTREAEQRMKDRIAAAANKISRFKTDAEYLEEENVTRGGKGAMTNGSGAFGFKK